MTYNPQFPSITLPGLAQQPIPQFLGITIRQPVLPPLEDLDSALNEAMTASERLNALAPGARVAVAVGSRGIADLPRIVRGVIDRLTARGFSPFIVPAMGSHGGGTDKGQADMLDHLGVSEESTGAPVLSSMETVDLGEVETNVHAHIDRNAFEADGIVIVARVKTHTTFESDIESGLHKMVAVGLGKAMGARNVHIYGRRGLVELMPRIAEQSLAKAPFALGVAVVENGLHQLAVLEGVSPEDFPEADRRLLALSKSCAPSLPFAQADLLVVEYLGKNISGAGMDSKVIGREGFRGDPPLSPYINSIVALRTTEVSDGNSAGVGNADFIPLDMANKMDMKAMAFNAVTAAVTARVRVPPVLPTELDVVRAGLRICWQPDLSLVRACVIQSTSALDRMLVTRPLLDELRAEGKLKEIWKESHDLEFDGNSVLVSGL
ncbi:nickel pincer cofactor-dependent isomerase, group 22 [Desulfocurvus sp. DL9XJH121]